MNYRMRKLVSLTARGIDGQTMNSDGTESDYRDVEYVTMVIVVFWVFLNTIVLFLPALICDVLLYIAHISAILLYMAAVNEVANLKLKIMKLTIP